MAQIEAARCRRPLAAMFNTMRGHRWIPQYNLQWKFSQEGGLDGESGRPDGYTHQPGGHLAYVEFKADEGSIPFGNWRDNQRAWWQNNCVAPGCSTPYWIAVHLTIDRNVTRLNNKRAFAFLLTPQTWLATEKTGLALGTKSIATCEDSERILALKPFNAEALWGNYRLEFSAGMWKIPEQHPFFSYEIHRSYQPVGEPSYDKGSCPVDCRVQKAELQTAGA